MPTVPRVHLLVAFDIDATGKISYGCFVPGTKEYLECIFNLLRRFWERLREDFEEDGEKR